MVPASTCDLLGRQHRISAQRAATEAHLFPMTGLGRRPGSSLGCTASRLSLESASLCSRTCQVSAQAA
jgi:hypothetical protein